MAINLLLRCNSVERTKRFYSDVLGFDVLDSAEATCTVTKGGGTIIFTESDLWNAVPGMAGTIYFFLSDVDSYYAQVKDIADVRWTLEQMSHGTREFGIADCNGYTLAFAQSKFNSAFHADTQARL